MIGAREVGIVFSFFSTTFRSRLKAKRNWENKREDVCRKNGNFYKN